MRNPLTLTAAGAAAAAYLLTNSRFERQWRPLRARLETGLDCSRLPARELEMWEAELSALAAEWRFKRALPASLTQALSSVETEIRARSGTGRVAGPALAR